MTPAALAGTFFCYICGESISGYGHFRAYQGCELFDEEELWNEDGRPEDVCGALPTTQFWTCPAPFIGLSTLLYMPYNWVAVQGAAAEARSS